MRALDHEHIVGHARSAKSRENMEQTWTGEYMSVHLTWSPPIIVLANPQGLVRPCGLPLPLPCTLLEGHRRLRCLMGRCLEGRPVLPAHEVWIVTADPQRVMKRTP